MSYAFTILLLAGTLTGFAAMPRPQAEWLASAIYFSEGGKLAHPLYGLKEGSRTVCLARLDREWDAWAQAGQPGPDFVDWLGRTWAPEGLLTGDPHQLNRNWIPNVRRLYLKRSKL